MMKVFKYIYHIFLGFLGLIALLLIVSAFPITGNYQIKTVLSGSMEPVIKTGALIVVKPVEEYKIEDVITFVSGEEVVTHRIADVEVIEGNLQYITKGDANDDPDANRVKPRSIIGKVLVDIPYLGYAVEAAQQPFGFMLIIVVPATIIISDELKRIWKEIKKMRSGKKGKEQDKKIDELEEEIDELKKEVEK